MLLDCKQLFESIGESREFSFALDLSGLELWGARPFQTPVQVSGAAQNRAGILSLSLTAGYVLDVACSRCCKPFSEKRTQSFSHILVREILSDDDITDSYVAVENDRVDLDELVGDDILLNMPFKMLCKDDCKGLCETCGADLNEGDCSCSRKRVDPRLAALQSLLDEAEEQE